MSPSAKFRYEVSVSPSLRDAAEAAPADQAGSTASPPAPPKVGQRGCFRKQGGATPPYTCNDGVPWQPAGPRFRLTPHKVPRRQPSTLKVALGMQQRHAGVALGSQDTKCSWAGSPLTPPPPAQPAAMPTGHQGTSMPTTLSIPASIIQPSHLSPFIPEALVSCAFRAACC